MYIYKSKVKNHKEIKKTLLEQINLIPQNSIITNKSNILHSDWNLPPNMHREYSKLFFEIIKPHCSMILKDLKGEKCVLKNFWFQRYKENQFHGWHVHGNCHFANVYYLECPKGAGTKFKNISKECEEGDILSFPSFLPHMSSPLEKNSIKTIIAFNIDIEMRD